MSTPAGHQGVNDPAADASVAPDRPAQTGATSARTRARKAWAPEVDAEVAELLRLLARQPWLVSGRDDDAIAAVRRNQGAVGAAFNRLGWVLVVERDLVRLRKSPPPRPREWAVEGPDPLTCSWFFILVAAAESLAPRVGLAELATAARAAAGEAGLEVTGQMPERRAIVAALKLLDERGVITQLDGDVEGFLHDDNAPVLLAIHHTRLLHVIATTGPGADPSADRDEWLRAVRRENDVARRMRRRLVDDAVVHTCDLDDAELDWLSRRLRGDDGGPLAQAFGLSIERRAEGAAFVVPDENYRHGRDLGPMPFPVAGTVPHAALLLCDRAASHGYPSTAEPGSGLEVNDTAAEQADLIHEHAGPGTGWRGLYQDAAREHLREQARHIGSGRGGWSAELVENPDALAAKVRDLLRARDLLRISYTPTKQPIWWFSPATGRWPAPAAARAVAREDTDQATLFDATQGPT